MNIKRDPIEMAVNVSLWHLAEKVIFFRLLKTRTSSEQYLFGTDYTDITDGSKVDSEYSESTFRRLGKKLNIQAKSVSSVCSALRNPCQGTSCRGGGENHFRM